MEEFKKAKEIWAENLKEPYNQFVGFFTQIRVDEERKVTLRISARSYYRLFINGEMAAHGPARTAVHYCRIDEIKVSVSGTVDFAFEVEALSKPEGLCNDCTMESGMLIAEIEDQNGNILAATGDDSFTCGELTYRRTRVEHMSHCRGIVEYYDLTPESFCWRRTGFQMRPVCLEETIHYLERRSGYASYARIPLVTMQQLSDVVSVDDAKEDTLMTISRLVNPKWYHMIPEENFFLKELHSESDECFTGICMQKESEERQRKIITLRPGKSPVGILWSMKQSEVGFIEFDIRVKGECVIDLLNADCLDRYGKLPGNTYASRFCLQPGFYHIITFEPRLIRYLKMILRTEQEVEILSPVVVDDSYQDNENSYFECSDGELNEIYHAARRTLRLNTLDIFMDCPERERGGWLCDSYFTARGAWQMFGDLSVEKDFIENFMKTDPDDIWNGFFPEVYPSVRVNSNDPGIRNWSFWLLEELYEYYDRSGDREFVDECCERVDSFIQGLLSLRGCSGLLENLHPQHLDWSLSNRTFTLEPISIPNNCLAINMLEKMAELYARPDWKQVADEMRSVIEKMDQANVFGNIGDAAEFHEKTQQLMRKDCRTESGIALELWSGLHQNDKEFIRKFVEEMGTCPEKCPDPNIGRSNLFIGFMLRFDVLSRLGKSDTLIKEWKNVYLPQLRNGAGTLFEAINEESGCHGFNACTGAMITNMILGLGQPSQRTRTVRISPHPGKLDWASGSAYCEDGRIALRWHADRIAHQLDMYLELPCGWNAEWAFPFELTGWTVTVNGRIIKVQCQQF